MQATQQYTELCIASASPVVTSMVSKLSEPKARDVPAKAHLSSMDIGANSQ